MRHDRDGPGAGREFAGAPPTAAAAWRHPNLLPPPRRWPGPMPTTFPTSRRSTTTGRRVTATITEPTSTPAWSPQVDARQHGLSSEPASELTERDEVRGAALVPPAAGDPRVPVPRRYWSQS